MKNMKVLINYGWLLLLVLIASCGEEIGQDLSGIDLMAHKLDVPTIDATSKESVAEYVNWVKDEENGLKQVKSIGDLTFEALLKPPVYCALIDSKGKSITNDELREQSVGQSELYQLEFSLQNKTCSDELLKCGVADMGEYQQRVQYYSFQLNNDAYLVIDKDTIPCGAHHWERAFDATNKITMQMVFDKPRTKLEFEKMQLVYYDRVFGNGLIKFMFGNES
jgi:hypothetical protein